MRAFIIDKPAATPPAAPEMPASCTPVASRETKTVKAKAHETAGTTPSTGDDLKHIVGIGPWIEAQLKQIGVTRFADIAAWSEADIARISAEIGGAPLRIHHDNWISQARRLARPGTGRPSKGTAARKTTGSRKRGHRRPDAQLPI